MKTVKLTVRGMHCGGCVSRVESALGEVDGVRSVQVSLDDEEATVEAEDAGPDHTSLVEAVEGAGYEASVED